MVLFKAKMPAEDKRYQLSNNYSIIMTRAIDEEVDGMCDLSKGVREEGRAEGKIQMAIDMTLGLMRTTRKSMDEVMDMADVDKAIRPEVEKAIKSKNLSI